MDLLDLFQRFGLALGIGFLIGLERGWKQREEKEGLRAAGLRTFTLSALLGALAAALSLQFDSYVLAAFAIAFAAPFAWFSMKEAEAEGVHSVTNVVAALVTFALGAYALIGSMQLAAALAVVTVALLAFKQGLHEWLRGLTWKEVRSAVIILAATFIALPLLPDRTIDPWGLINPRSLWLLTILVAGASFAGYVALRALGEKAGLPIGAAMGAIASSTVVTTDLARRAKANEIPATHGAAAASLATTVMLARIGILAAIVAGPTVRLVAPALIVAGIVSTLAYFVMRQISKEESESGKYEAVQSPLDLKSVLKFAALLGVLTIGAKLVTRTYGAAGLIPFAATAGLADADAVTLAVGTMARQGLNPVEAAEAILLGVAMNTLYKNGVGAVIGGRTFALWFGAASLLTIASGAAAFYLIRL